MNITLKMSRIKNGMSQHALAKAIGISQALISGYERGYLLPPPDRATKIASILGVRPERLFKKGT